MVSSECCDAICDDYGDGLVCAECGQSLDDDGDVMDPWGSE